MSFGLATLLDFCVSGRSSTADLITPSLYGSVRGLLRMYAPTASVLLKIKALRRSVVEGLKAYLGPGRTCLGLLLAGASRCVSGCRHISAPGAGRLSRGPGEARGIVRRPSGLWGLGSRRTTRGSLWRSRSSYLCRRRVYKRFFALGEELGWRGYLYRWLGFPALSENNPRHRRCVGMWHATAIGLLGHNYPQLRRARGAPLCSLLCVAVCFMMRLVDAAGSVPPAVSIHGAFNVLWDLTVLFTAGEGAAGEAVGIDGSNSSGQVAEGRWAVKNSLSFYMDPASRCHEFQQAA